MFNKIIALLLILPACISMLFAQKATVKISPEFKLSKSRAFERHLFSDATGHYVYFYDYTGGVMLSKLSSTTVLEKYDSTFKLVYSKEYKADRKGIASLGMRYFNGQFVWLFSETNKKEDYIRYSVLPIDLEGMQGKPKDIARFKYENRDDIPDVSWSISRDSSKLLYLAASDNDKDDQKFGIYLSVFDKNLDVFWSRKVDLMHTEEQTDVISTVLKNDGSVYMLCKVYEGRKAKESKKNDKKNSVAAYEMVLYHFTKESDPPGEVRLKLGDLFIKGASLAVSKDDEVKCTGFFSTTKKGSLNGVFYLQLAPDGTVTSSSKKDFSVADLKKFGEKNIDKDRGGDIGLESSFKFSDFLVRDDGSAVVVAEENYKETRSSYNGRTWTTTTYYYSNDIVAFTINTAGEVDRVNVIPKRQMGVNTNYFISYVSDSRFVKTPNMFIPRAGNQVVYF